MKKKHARTILAAGTLWTLLLAAGCGSGSGRQATPTGPAEEPAASPPSAAEPSPTEGGKNGTAAIPAAEGGGKSPSSTLAARAASGGPQLPARHILAERLRINEERSARWTAVGALLAANGGHRNPEGWQHCSDLLREMVTGYGEILAERPGTAAPAGFGPGRTEVDAFTPFLREIAFQENRCESAVFDAGVRTLAERIPPAQWGGSLASPAGWPLSARTRLLCARGLAGSGNLGGAIALLQSLPAEPLSFEEIGEQSRLLADSLLAAGRYAEASAAYQRLVAGAGSGGKLQAWARAHADMLLHAGDNAEAFLLYESVMRAALASSPDTREEALLRLETAFPKSPVTALALTIHRAGGRGGDAASGNAGVSTSAAPAETGLAPLPTLTEEQRRRWEEALKLLELKRHDEAIALFSLLNNSPYAEQAKSKIRAAATLAASELRQRAAAVFSKARKATTPADQQALLLQSKNLLETALTRYPETEIRDKLIQNLREVDRQLSGSATSGPGLPPENPAR